MSNFAKAQCYYIRKLGRNGKTRQVTLPTGIVRASRFSEIDQVVVHLTSPNTLTMTTLDHWFREDKP